MKASVSRGLLLLSLAAYAASLPLVAFCLGERNCDLTSWNVLIYGWIAMAVIQHPPHAIWLANPILLIAWGFIAGELKGQSDETKKRRTSEASGLRPRRLFQADSH